MSAEEYQVFERGTVNAESGNGERKDSEQESREFLNTDPDWGLGEFEADRRLEQDGKNELTASKERSMLRMFFDQLNDPLIYVLIASAAVSVWLSEYADASIIGVVVLMNAIIGMVQEGRAKKALDALKQLTTPKAIVIREGVKKEIPASQVVVGDLVWLEAGAQVPADMRLVQTVQLGIEESALTGENLPAEKNAGFAAESDDIPLGDRLDMAFMSTIVTSGHGKGIVTATGMDTQIGQIASMISEDEEQTPLQKRLGDLGKVLSIVSLLLCGILFVLAMYQHRDVMDMLLAAISLAVAAVPEGLPAVVTICLALSVTRMVRANTIIRRLPSVETLGSVTVVCSDKTGTLTQNRMTVEKCLGFGENADLGEEYLNKEFLRGMVLCNNAEPEENLGDPTELALLHYGCKYGFERADLEEYLPRIGEIPFDSDRKMMTTCHRGMNGLPVSYVKGAPDVVLKHCSAVCTEKGQQSFTQVHLKEIEKALADMSSEALRTLAVAVYFGGEGPVEDELTFLGLVGMRDPVRPEAVEAVKTFRQAGVKTVMITGDHADTALSVARQLGIADQPEQCMKGEELGRLDDEELARTVQEREITVFARVSPTQKMRIVKAFKSAGEVVAMTGDGVNDAPSLKSADIGIAMGKSGTDVAKQASDMILVDDNFATIERAIEEGRNVYENIRKSVIFLLSSNFGEILTMFVAVLVGLAAPLKSSHILWINLITDSLPALALGVDANDRKSLMRSDPRKPGESLFSRGGLAITCFYGLLIAGISLAAFLLLPCVILKAEGSGITLAGIRGAFYNDAVLTRAQTYAFTVLGISQLFHAIGMRDVTLSVFSMNHRDNKLMIASLLFGYALQCAVTRIPFLVSCFGTGRLSGGEWLLLTGLSMVPLVAHELMVLSGRMLGVVGVSGSGKFRDRLAGFPVLEGKKHRFHG